MKRKVSIIVSVLFFGVMAVCFLSSPAYSFWYGATVDGDPFCLGTLYPLPEEPTCLELTTLRRSITGRPMRNWSNAEPGDGGISRALPGKYWKGMQLLSCVGGCSHPDVPYVQDVDEDGNPVFDPDTGEPVMVPKLFFALLITTEGDFINGWDDINAIPGKLLPNGEIMGGAGGGFGGDYLVIQDWSGEETWSWEVVGGRWHHDFNRADSWSGNYAPGKKYHARMDGKTLVLANHTPGEYYPAGDGYPEHPARDTSHISNYPLIDDAIHIIDENGNIEWSWYACDHFEQMGFDQAAKDAIMTINVGRGGNTDWTHFNNVNWLGPNKWCVNENACADPRFHPENIIFDSRTLGMIGIIDHETGNIVWKIGPNFGEDTPFEDANPGIGPIIGPHNAHMIPKELRGGGNIIVFDNGGNSNYGLLSYKGTECGGSYPVGVRDYSRILEINPVTYEVVWMYQSTVRTVDAKTGFVTRKFFSSFISGVQRTIKGTTIITEGNQARIFEVDRNGKIVWEYNAAAEPGGPGVIGRALYRSYRYPMYWIPNELNRPNDD